MERFNPFWLSNVINPLLQGEGPLNDRELKQMRHRRKRERHLEM